MSVGFIMLVHDALDRAALVARHLHEHGQPVVLHVDERVSGAEFKWFRDGLRNCDHIHFCPRHACEWGSWSIVAATLTASEVLLKNHPDLGHVYLASGSCLPLRPVAELQRYLEERPRTDFIESVTTDEVDWTIGGLDRERFTLRFPFSWKRRRRLFDGYVRLQRRLKFRRHIPSGLTPHLGSQWWCLTRETLLAILNDPRRVEYDRYFRRVWIPDESYFQTLSRLHTRHIESRSLTLSKFDFQGKPHVFYDDHMQLLRQSDCFVARKIWPEAEQLYRHFLAPPDLSLIRLEPNPLKIDRLFSRATERRIRGRTGLYMSARYPNNDRETRISAARYSVFQGFEELFDGFDIWLSRRTGNTVHNRLFSQNRVEFVDAVDITNGALSSSNLLRDYNPKAFLTNLIWNTRGSHQCFMFGPNDQQDISKTLANDTNAQISVISGAWAIPLFHSDRDFSDVRKEAARLQRIEAGFIELLRDSQTRARVSIWTLAEFIEDPMEKLQMILDELGGGVQRRLAEVPQMADLEGFGQFLQSLKNQGMSPHLMGDFPVLEPGQRTDGAQRPYLVR